MTELTTMYRVENPEGLGPYRRFTVCGCGYGLSDKKLWLKSEDHDDDHHPVPWAEGLEIHGNRLCGFKDLEQLSKWFTDEELVKLYYYGFQIMEYEAIEVQVGKYQATFLPFGKGTPLLKTG